MMEQDKNAKMVAIAERRAQAPRNQHWNVDDIMAVLTLVEDGKGDADIVTELVDNGFAFSKSGEKLEKGNSAQRQRITDVRKEWEKVTGKASASSGRGRPKGSATVKDASNPKPRAQPHKPQAQQALPGFLSAFMKKGAAVVEAAEDLQSEKLARFHVTQRINQERTAIIFERDRAASIVAAAHMALERLDYLEKLNVHGEDGRSVETLQKLLDNPNGNAEGMEDGAEDAEVRAAHDMASGTRVVRDGEESSSGSQQAQGGRRRGSKGR